MLSDKYTKRNFNIFPPRVILWGGTGQAKVVRPIIEYYGSKVVAVFDDNPRLKPPFADIPLYYRKRGFQKWIKSQKREELAFCVAIGNPLGRVRVKLHEWLIKEGLKATTIVHPSVEIADDAVVGEGCQLLVGSIIGVQARLGRECIINTNTSVDHECVLEDGAAVGPGVTLCGEVKVGTNGWICAGATVLPKIEIGADAIVGAGAVVISDVAKGTTVVGVPASRILSRK